MVGGGGEWWMVEASVSNHSYHPSSPLASPRKITHCPSSPSSSSSSFPCLPCAYPRFRLSWWGACLCGYVCLCLFLCAYVTYSCLCLYVYVYVYVYVRVSEHAHVCPPPPYLASRLSKKLPWLCCRCCWGGGGGWCRMIVVGVGVE